MFWHSNPKQHYNSWSAIEPTRYDTTHVPTQNTAGQSQPQGSNDHTTAANATGHTKH